jgi:hypothetical protein
MQSTGQTGMHSSQPVHSDSITVCISSAADDASTGQAFRHSVQPMHQASSIRRGGAGPRPLAGVRAQHGSAGDAASRDAFAPPAGMVDRRDPRDGLA